MNSLHCDMERNSKNDSTEAFLLFRNSHLFSKSKQTIKDQCMLHKCNIKCFFKLFYEHENIRNKFNYNKSAIYWITSKILNKNK